LYHTFSFLSIGFYKFPLKFYKNRKIAEDSADLRNKFVIFLMGLTKMIYCDIIRLFFEEEGEMV
jgi:hypothetical protein